METIAKLFIFSFIVMGITSCYTAIPLKEGKSENNTTYKVSYLFEHDGYRVYRFYDRGNYVISLPGEMSLPSRMIQLHIGRSLSIKILFIPATTKYILNLNSLPPKIFFPAITC